MQIIDNKAVLLNVRNPDQITAAIPKSRKLSENQVIVNWGLDEMQVLRNLQIKNAPSPILGRYAWPGQFQPYAHQKDTSAFLTMHRRAFCFNEQGTGKTGSVIWAADYLMSIGAVRRALIICPVSIMDSAWRADLFKVAMHRTVDIAYGARSKRQAVVNSTAEFVIINYAGIEIVTDEIANGGFDLIAVDECFVAGTPVHTPRGPRPIEDIKAGDEVLTSAGVQRTKRLVRNTATQLVGVTLEDGSRIECTPDHPFFTDAGWVCAKNTAGRRLISCDAVSSMRGRIPAQSLAGIVGASEQLLDRSNLLKILCSEEVAQPEPGQELLQPDTARTTGQTVGAEDGGTSSEVILISQSERLQAESTGWQRDGDDTYGTTDCRGLACGVGMELPSSVGYEAARLSYELQARLRMAAPQSGARGGWGKPHGSGAAGTGSEERSQASGTRVVSVSYIERPDGQPVYNVEVEGTPNYFVGSGWLVHNCNAYKNAQTKRWKALAKLIKPDTWLWMLTGTPAAQSPVDAYGIAKLVNPQGVPRFFTAFKEQVLLKVTNFKWIPKSSSSQTVFNALQPAIRYTKAECLDLPPMTYVRRTVELTKQQQKYYDVLKSKMMIKADGEAITSVNAAVNLSKLLQLSCGAVYSDEGEVLEFDISKRYNVLLEVIEESNNKVLVFVPFKHVISILHSRLTADSITNEVISGDVPASKRTEIFQAFQTQADPKVLVIQPNAAAHGVTLTAADTVVWWGPVSSLETYAQANARVDRVGQCNNTTVVQLAGSPVERKVYDMLDKKIDVHNNLIDRYNRLIE